MSQMLRLLEMQGMQPHNLQDRPNLRAQDFKTFRHATLTKHRKYQRCGECWECSRLATKKCKNLGFSIFPRSNHPKLILATSSNTLKIDFQKHDNAVTTACTGGELQNHPFLQNSTVPQSITALGPTQTPNRQLPASLETAKHH